MQTQTSQTNWISRIKEKWASRTRAFKIFYILLVVLSLICLGICLWSLVTVELTRQELFDKITKGWNDGGYSSYTADQWKLLETTTNPIEKFFYILHTKYHDDITKYSWTWASKANVPGLTTDLAPYSATCYILFPIFGLIWLPVTIYVVASFLNTAFPHYSKAEKKAMKAAREQAQALAQQEAQPEPQPQPKKSTKPKPQPKKQNTNTPNQVIDVGHITIKIPQPKKNTKPKPQPKPKMVNGIATTQKHTVVKSATANTNYNYKQRLSDWKKKAGYNERPHTCSKCHHPNCHTSILLDNNKHVCYYCWIKKPQANGKRGKQ